MNCSSHVHTLRKLIIIELPLFSSDKDTVRYINMRDQTLKLVLYTIQLCICCDICIVIIICTQFESLEFKNLYYVLYQVCVSSSTCHRWKRFQDVSCELNASYWYSKNSFNSQTYWENNRLLRSHDTLFIMYISE
jgi:hypothetical protein